MSWQPQIQKCPEAVDSTGWFGLIAGLPGTGKTFMIRTVPNLGRTLALNLENGFRSVKDLTDLDVINVEDSKHFERVLGWLEGGQVGQYDLIYLDSITELADMTFREAKVSDNRHRYMEAKQRTLAMITRLRRLRLSVVATCGVKRNSETGLLQVLAPGQELPAYIPHQFDFVAATRTRETDKGTQYALQFKPGGGWDFVKARDPHGVLGEMEAPDLRALFSKLEPTHPTEGVKDASN